MIKFSDLIKRNKKKLKNEEEVLEDSIERIENEINLKDTDKYLEDIDPAASQDGEQKRLENIESESILKRYLKNIRYSLKLIKTKKYGKCRKCGKDIGKERLEADPSIIYCIECEKIIENEIR